MTDIEVGRVYTYTPDPDWDSPWNVPGITQIVSLDDGVAEYEIIEGMSMNLKSRNFHLNSQFAEHLSPDTDRNLPLDADPDSFELSFDSLIEGTHS